MFHKREKIISHCEMLAPIAVQPVASAKSIRISCLRAIDGWKSRNVKSNFQRELVIALLANRLARSVGRPVHPSVAGLTRGMVGGPFHRIDCVARAVARVGNYPFNSTNRKSSAASLLTVMAYIWPTIKPNSSIVASAASFLAAGHSICKITWRPYYSCAKR